MSRTFDCPGTCTSQASRVLLVPGGGHSTTSVSARGFPGMWPVPTTSWGPSCPPFWSPRDSRALVLNLGTRAMPGDDRGLWGRGQGAAGHPAQPRAAPSVLGRRQRPGADPPICPKLCPATSRGALHSELCPVIWKPGLVGLSLTPCPSRRHVPRPGPSVPSVHAASRPASSSQTGCLL